MGAEDQLRQRTAWALSQARCLFFTSRRGTQRQAKCICTYIRSYTYATNTSTHALSQICIFGGELPCLGCSQRKSHGYRSWKLEPRKSAVVPFSFLSSSPRVGYSQKGNERIQIDTPHGCAFFGTQHNEWFPFGFPLTPQKQSKGSQKKRQKQMRVLFYGRPCMRYFMDAPF